VSDKVQLILDIWGSGLGVVSLHCFQSVIPVEAYTREACMVDAMGMDKSCCCAAFSVVVSSIYKYL